jgi:hypothetical protein
MVLLPITRMRMAPNPIYGNRQSLRNDLRTGPVYFGLHDPHSSTQASLPTPAGGYHCRASGLVQPCASTNGFAVAIGRWPLAA